MKPISRCHFLIEKKIPNGIKELKPKFKINYRKKIKNVCLNYNAYLSMQIARKLRLIRLCCQRVRTQHRKKLLIYHIQKSQTYKSCPP